MPVDMSQAPTLVKVHAILADMHNLMAMQAPDSDGATLSARQVRLDNQDALDYIHRRLAAFAQHDPAAYALAQDLFAETERQAQVRLHATKDG